LHALQIHEIIDGRTDRAVYKTPFAFRLLYNGKVLTPLIDGCPSDAELCDARFLKKRVDHFATRSRDCSVEESPPSQEVFHDAASLLSTIDGIMLFLSVVLVSAFLGGLGTFTFLTGRFPTLRVTDKFDGSSEEGIQFAPSEKSGVGFLD
jgi:hypothetical protein